MKRIRENLDMTDHCTTQAKIKTALLLLAVFSLTTLGLTGCPPGGLPVHKDFWDISVEPTPTGCESTFFVNVDVKRSDIAVSYYYSDDLGYSTGGVLISDASGLVLIPIAGWRDCTSPIPTPTPNETLAVWVEEWGGAYGVSSGAFWTGVHLLGGSES
jgi:hypothetical protein